ncbi:methyltransferase [Dongshaea marina]|uniref:methyltransferase n=1 Tax=Dongshaea marina TaxID=2047966 RepID=UPI000D3EBB3A|nr:methyltransferase [Dongshaea marina]
MKTQFLCASLELDLYRYPKRSKETLQAWDSADEYLLEELSGFELQQGQPLLVYNDQFGALTCSLIAQNHPVTQVSDSCISDRATQANLAENQLPTESLTQQDPLSPLKEVALVLLKVPKNQSLLEWQLANLQQQLPAGTRIIAAGKAKEIHTSTLKLFEKYLGSTHTSLAKKKARLIFSEIAEKEPLPLPSPVVWPLEKSSYQISNYANVFSRNQLDIGARFFISHLPTGCQGDIIDLGCGNGVVGLMALEKNPEAKVIFVDESKLAVASARFNIEKNRPQDLYRCEFHVNNCLDDFAKGEASIVLCNPPFHQQQTITDHIARQMFRDARQALARGGELWVIGNRHLGYHIQLKKLFGNCQNIAGNKKFSILKALR